PPSSRLSPGRPGPRVRGTGARVTVRSGGYAQPCGKCVATRESRGPAASRAGPVVPAIYVVDRIAHPFDRERGAHQRNQERAWARVPEVEGVARTIALHGLPLVHVGEGCDCADCTEPAAPPEERFGYTIGLTARGHPELLVRGLGAQETAELLNRWGRTVLAGDVFEEGDLLCEGPGGPTWELGPVYRQARTLAWATRYYGPDRLRLRPPLELRPSRQPCMCGRCD